MTHRKFSRFALLITAALSCFHSAPARANYKAKAEDATSFIQANFYDADAKLYRAAAPADDKALPYDFMWANGVQFSVLAGAAQHNPRNTSRC